MLRVYWFKNCISLRFVFCCGFDMMSGILKYVFVYLFN